VTVTLPHCCEGCGGSLEGRRPHARTCSPKCRQRVSRGQKRDTAAKPSVSAPTPLSELRQQWFALSPEERDEKREAIAAAARARLEAGPTIRDSDRALFASDPGRVAA
jgi:hypothetical protein